MRVCVVVPTYNGRDRITACLKALLAQDFDGELDILVVDDGSGDGTADAIRRAFGDRVRVLAQPNQGPASARNLGARAASGEVLLFTDDDCVPEPDWVRSMVRPFVERSEVVGVKGVYRTRQSSLTARFVQIEYEDRYDLMAGRPTIDFVDTYSAGFRREAFLAMNGYDTSFPVPCAEDVELSYRMSALGLVMVFNPKAVVWHTHPDRLWKYLAKKRKFAFWRVLAVRKNPDKLSGDSHTPQVMKLQLLAPPLVLGLGLAGLLKPGLGLAALGVLALFMLSTVPFTLKALAKDRAVGLLAPGFLLLRAVAQFLGVAGGALHVLARPDLAQSGQAQAGGPGLSEAGPRDHALPSPEGVDSGGQDGARSLVLPDLDLERPGQASPGPVRWGVGDDRRAG